MAKKSLQLGRPVRLPASPDRAQLDRVPNPHPDTDYVARFTAPEFTVLCPVTGQPDFAHFVIDYAPGRWLLESKSLKIKIPREQYNSLTQKLGTFGEDWRIRANDGHFMRITAGADPFVCFYGLHDDSASATLDLSLLVRRSTNDTSGSREPSEIKASLKFERVQ